VSSEEKCLLSAIRRQPRRWKTPAFAMKKELEEAEAAVEEWYRRRARRAGLEGVLPVGRPMSEGRGT
jgi:hypothetical protein